MKRHFTALYALLLAIVPSACSMHGQSTTPSLPPYTQNIVQPFDTSGGISNMAVRVGDAAPAFFGNRLSGINLAFSEIDAVDSAGHNVVVGQYSTPLIVNLLKYQDGLGANVGQTQVSQKTYQQIRFVIDTSASSVLYTGGASAGLRFVRNNDHSSANAGGATSTTSLGHGRVAITVSQPFAIGSTASELVNVDFNLMESLTPPSIDTNRGQGNNLASDTHGGLALAVRPTLFVAANSNGGQITGTVVNSRGNGVSNAVVVAVDQNGQVGNTVATDASGNFLLHTLAAGTYRLDIYNNYTNSAGANFSSEGSSSDRSRLKGSTTVTVSPGQVTDAGTITD